MIKKLIYLSLSIAAAAILFGPNPAEARSAIKNQKSYQAAKKLVHKMSSKRKYDLARYAILFNDTQFARIILSQLLQNNRLPKDEIQMMIARSHFQDGSFSKSLSWYNQVRKDSDFWLEAQEERAWVLYRLNRNDALRASLETLFTPVFSDLISSETYYLDSLSKLRTCDYEGVLKVGNLMKSDYNDRVASLEKLAQSSNKSIAKKIIAEAKINSRSDKKEHLIFGPFLKTTPLYFYRDSRLGKGSRISNSRLAATLKQRSQTELKEISNNIRRLHLVEAEVMQRVYNNSDKINDKEMSIASSGDVLIFPKNNDEIWADEIENFQASVKTCKKGGRTL